MPTKPNHGGHRQPFDATSGKWMGHEGGASSTPVAKGQAYEAKRDDKPKSTASDPEPHKEHHPAPEQHAAREEHKSFITKEKHEMPTYSQPLGSSVRPKEEPGAESTSKRVETTEDLVAKFQAWVDYDFETYGGLSATTSKYLKDSGLDVIKDQYGDYEVTVKDDAPKPASV